MRWFHWIPGWGHFKLGQKRKGAIFAIVAAFFAGLAVWNASAMQAAVSHAVDKLGGAEVPYTLRDFDFLFSTIFVTVTLIGLVVYSGRSCRRYLHRDQDAEKVTGQWDIVWRQFKKNRLAVIGMVLILVLYVVTILCPFLAPRDPTEQGNRVLERLLAPSAEHPFGTDRFARDVFSRILYGSRVSLMVGFLSVGIAVTIGTLYGAVSGYVGGWMESVMMRFVDLMLSLPTLVLIITVLALWRQQSIWIVISVIGVTSWMGVARLVRGQFLVLKEREFFHAARALGASPVRLITRHLLPNALTPIIVSATLRVGNTILLEAGLSYLGLGVQPPTPSWGNIVYETKGSLFTEWWLPLSAGLAILVTVVGYNLLGDGLRDALDPRLRQ